MLSFKKIKSGDKIVSIAAEQQQQHTAQRLSELCNSVEEVEKKVEEIDENDENDENGDL